MPKSDKNFLVRLIHEVKQRKCLYDPSHPNYKDRQQNYAEWFLVGQSLGGVPAMVAKKRWQTLRGSYSQCINGTRGSKDNWYLKKRMDFLQKYMMRAPALAEVEMNLDSTNIKEDLEDIDPSLVVQSEAQALSSDQMVHAEEPSHQLPVVDMQSSYPSGQSSPSSTFIHRPDSQLEAQSQEGSDELDLCFLKGLLPYVTELNKKNKRLFHQTITAMLFDLLNEQEQEEHVSFHEG